MRVTLGALVLAGLAVGGLVLWQRHRTMAPGDRVRGAQEEDVDVAFRPLVLWDPGTGGPRPVAQEL